MNTLSYLLNYKDVIKTESKYTINLTKEDVEKLRAIVDDPKSTKTRKVKAELLLDLDGVEKPFVVIEGLISIYGISKSMIYRLMERYSREGIEAVKKSPNPTSRRPHVMTPKVEETVLSWIKTPPPAGKNRWSAYVIAEKLMEDGLAENVSYQTIYCFLAKKGIKL